MGQGFGGYRDFIETQHRLQIALELSSDAEFCRLIIDDAGGQCRITRNEDQIIDVRNRPDAESSTTFENLVQNLAGTGPQHADGAVSAQVLDAHFCQRCNIGDMPLFPE